jgi:hypothetical protein
LPFDDVVEAFRLLEEEPDTTMRVHLQFGERDDRAD